MSSHRSTTDSPEPIALPRARAAAQPLTDRNYRALAQFRRALRVFERFSEQEARAAGLTPAQHQLMLAIRGHDGNKQPSMSELADGLQLRLHSVGELVDRAEANGLVIRRSDPHDQRRCLLSLTADGDRQLRDLSVLHRAELRRFRNQMADLLNQLDA